MASAVGAYVGSVSVSSGGVASVAGAAAVAIGDVVVVVKVDCVPGGGDRC